MPTYQYACTVCDERLEVVQKFTDEPMTQCPVCGGRLRKVYSAVGVVFKGSGFYRTDSRQTAKGAATSSPNGSSDSSTSESTSKAESKSESKAESTSKPASAAATSSSTSE